jgi:hypothetical protein
MHLKDDDLVLHYYGEVPAAGRRRVSDHLRACETCAAAYAELRAVLVLADQAPVEEPGPGFEREMWARVQGQLARGPWWRRTGRVPLSWAAAGAVAAALVAAFLAGWLARGPVDQAPPALDAELNAIDRILVMAVGDHLERSQMVLVELMNTEDGDEVVFAGGRDGVAELVAANRLYRHSAASAGEGTLAEVLDELERILVELANAPPDEMDAALVALRDRVERRGILFRVRVLSSEMRAREQQPLAGRQRSES